MTISSLGSSNYDYGRFASGKKLNTAADGAAELSIAKKQETTVGTYKKQSENALANRDANNIADGAIAGITSNLQRINELSIRQQNGLLSDSDRQSIQAEIDQMKQGITDTANAAIYNEKNVLEGYDIENMSLEDISALRSKFGAQTNGLESSYNSLQTGAENLTASQSRLEDLDIPKAVSEQKKKEVLQQYQMSMQKKQMDEKRNLTEMMFK